MMVRVAYPNIFDELIEEFFTPALDVTPTVYPAIDILENDAATVVVAEVPGVKKEDVSLKYENNVLTISGERKPYEIPQDARILLNEMRVRKFTRSIEIPHDVDAEKITAEMNNGVLRVTLPKAEVARTRTIEIK
ncbi:MAG: Hsp20/alpha crystallin family protein [Bacteroidetes bacterium]|nr:Hsp20/alpha crystallin family protein [Bacteroidota bacterium]